MPPPSPDTPPAGPPIGGFFGLEMPAPRGDGGLAAAWGVAGTALAWANASSALAALVAAIRPGRVWLPGYICAHFVAAVPADLRRFFPLTPGFAPDLAALDGQLAPGDALLAVNMWGRAPGAAWRDFVAANPQATFIEDCAQALDSGVAPWGDWRLYSPRKLLGVPEGGLLAPVSARARAQAPDIALPAADGAGAGDPAAALARLAPALARAEAPAANHVWHPMNQAAEAAQAIGPAPMGRLARALLAATDPAPLVAARRDNYARLARALPDHELLGETAPGFAPAGFPVALAPGRRAAVLARLHGDRVFPAVHWAAIPAPPGFTADHARAASLATLPVDHRLGAGDMARMAGLFRAALA